LKIIVYDKTIYIDLPEDLIVTYLSAWKYRDSTLDRDKVLWLLIVLRDELDFEYLEKRAKEENVLDKFKELLKYT